MIILKHQRSDKAANRWVERLTDLVVPFRAEASQETGEPIICDGQRKVEGPQAIEEYLDELSQDIDAWYECTCDKYFDN